MGPVGRVVGDFSVSAAPSHKNGPLVHAKGRPPGRFRHGNAGFSGVAYQPCIGE
jgi:hypothetical protein